jgi:hypothetical protein
MKREGIILPSVKEIGDGKYSKWFLLVIFKLRSCNGGHVPLLLLVSFFFFILKKKIKKSQTSSMDLYMFIASVHPWMVDLVLPHLPSCMDTTGYYHLSAWRRGNQDGRSWI